MKPKSLPGSRTVVVIGGGISGLATAALLARNGWQVTLLEKNKTLGGRARTFRKKGFSFDMGPSWYLMPEVFDRYFAEFGKKTSDYYDLVRLNPRYKLFFGSAEGVEFEDDIKKNATWFERIERGAGDKLITFLQKMRTVYEAADTLIYQDLRHPRFWTSGRNLKAMSTVLRAAPLWNSWDAEVKRVFKDERLRQVLGFSSVFLGGSPFTTPSFYSMLAWADFGKGVWYPRGGMKKVVEALESVALEQGVEIQTGVEVTSIEVHNGQVTGVTGGTRFYPSERVVGATDIPMIETKLLPPRYREPGKWKSKTLGISAILLYAGIDRRVRNLLHHNIYFSTDWERNFREIEAKKIPTDPSCYISVRSHTDPSVAPKGSEELFVLIPVAAGARYSSLQISTCVEKVLSRLHQLTGTDIRKHLTVREVYTPEDFENDYNAYKGTALGLAHTLGQSLWSRPDNKSSIRGLYYAGQYTNPGVGVPMALISGQRVADLIGPAPAESTEIFKKGSTTYYYSSSFFKGQAKRDVFNVYAYVRTVDDLVDRAVPLLDEFETMWSETLSAWKNGECTHPIVRNFVEVAKRNGFLWEWVEAFWDSMRADLHTKTYQTFQQLETYIHGSAEVIGLMMARILNLPIESLPAAAMQGKAMQFVNFIRDVEEDRLLGRNYLGYTDEEMRDPQLWSRFIRAQIDRYRELQKAAEEGYRHIPKAYLVPIKTASDMYSWTADRIYRNPALVWQRKMKPGMVRVLTQLVKNYLMLP